VGKIKQVFVGEKLTTKYHYLRQRGYVFIVVCLSVCLLVTLRKNFQTDLHEIFRQGWRWASEQMITFWWD